MFQVRGLEVGGDQAKHLDVAVSGQDNSPSNKQPVSPAWSELNGPKKVQVVLVSVAKVVAILCLLYAFIFSLDMMSSGFRLLGGRRAGAVFHDTKLLQNPVVGLMIGVLVTVLVQSSSTSTSVVVTMVGAGLIQVKDAIPIIMGANIGTSVTNTIVALTQVQEREEFRRAFAAATIHDMFNWLTVLVLLPLEMATGYLEHVTGAIMGSREWQQNKEMNKEFLNKLTKPIMGLIIQLDKTVLEGIASKDSNLTNKSFIKRCCKYNETVCLENCRFLFQSLELSDAAIGGILCAISITFLTCSLVMMVKVLKSSLKGRVSKVLEKFFTTEKPFPYNILMGYTAILMGCLMTILLQSSSIFTSALTPLAGIGVVPLESMYPLTLGSNLGTTTTSILAAFAAPSSKIKDTLQIAFCHLFFNLTGILLFYPIPVLRFPIRLARALGDITAKYRWFAILYMILMFIFFPLLIFALSWAGNEVLAAVLGITFLLMCLIILMNVLQRRRPGMLPQVLRSWEWLPECLRSLEPLDRIVSRVCCCCKKRNDGSSLKLKANVSQVNIVESSKESHHLEGLENSGFIWARTNGASESTLL